MLFEKYKNDVVFANDPFRSNNINYNSPKEQFQKRTNLFSKKKLNKIISRVDFENARKK